MGSKTKSGPQSNTLVGKVWSAIGPTVWTVKRKLQTKAGLGKPWMAIGLTATEAKQMLNGHWSHCLDDETTAMDGRPWSAISLTA